VMKRGTQKETQEPSAVVPALLEAGQAGWACWARVAVHPAALLKAVPLHTPCTHCCEEKKTTMPFGVNEMRSQVLYRAAQVTLLSTRMDFVQKKEERVKKQCMLLSNDNGSLLRR